MGTANQNNQFREAHKWPDGTESDKDKGTKLENTLQDII